MKSASSVQEVLNLLNRNEDTEVAYITAATINVYLESLKRLQGRSKFEISDVENLMAVLRLLLGDRMVQKRPEAHPHPRASGVDEAELRERNGQAQ